MNKHPPVRLPVRHKLGYGIGCIAYSLPYQITASALLFYMTAVLNIPVLWAGAIIAASALWDAVIDPLLGYLSDNTESRRFGRRHQYLLIGGVLILLFSYALWSIDPNASSVFKIVSLTLLVFGLKTALTIFVIPYNALGGELSTDYDERSSIQSYRALFYIIGMIIALVGSNVFFFRSTAAYPKGQLNPEAYPAMGLTFGIIALSMALVGYFATRRYIPLLPQRSDAMKRKGLSWRHAYEDLRGALGNKDFRALTLMIFILEAGFQLGIVIGYHVNTYTYNLTGPVIGLLGLTLLSCSILSQPFWLWVTRHWEKKGALMLGMVIGLVGFLGMPWAHVAWHLFPLDGPSLPYTLGIFYILGGIGNGAFMSIPYSMVADAADMDELVSGKRDEGLYYGIYNFAYKLGTSLSLLASGVMLQVIGFKQGAATQTQTVAYYLAMAPSYLLILISPFVVLALSHYSISRRRHNAVRAQLDQR